MDSLRNLSTSLPRTSPAAASPHELLSAFKAAALSVTNLYKTAATEQARHRAAGYQDALDELLTFLDRENLGLGVDREGWRVRQWATERFQGTAGGHSDDEEEREDQQPQQETRIEEPEVQRKQEPQTVNAQEHEEEEVRVEAVPMPQQLTNPEMFTFRSSLSYPSSNQDRDTDMEAGSLSSDTVNGAPAPTATTTSATQHSSPPMAVNLLSRQRSNRHGHRHPSGGNRSANMNTTNLGTGAGSKRKATENFFDLGGFGGFGGNFGSNPGGKDIDRFGGGGKRGRHV